MAAAGLAGCDNLGDTLSDAEPLQPNYPSAELAHDGANKTILDYEIKFKLRRYEDQQTTFFYEVTRPSSAESALTFFFLESPDCAGPWTEVRPTQGSMGEEGDFTGIKWNSPGLQPGQTAIFSVTYEGDVPLGVVTAIMKRSSDVGQAAVYGACKGVPNKVNISGTVFVDANGSGTLDPGGESGIGRVTVELLHGESNAIAESTTTADDGSYLFQVVSGDYLLNVPSSTASSTDFNEHLYDYFDPTGDTAIHLGNIGSDTSNNDFGYEPDEEAIGADLKSGEIETTARKANWWAGEFRSVVNGKGKPLYDEQTLLDFLGQVENLLLPEIFTFDTGDPLALAFEILNRPLKSEQDELEHELLAAELNYIAGLGSGTRELDLAVFAFAESDWLNRFGLGAVAGGTSLSKATLSSTQLLSAYNDSGTGGGSGSGSLKRGEGD